MRDLFHFLLIFASYICQNILQIILKWSVLIFKITHAITYIIDSMKKPDIFSLLLSCTWWIDVREIGWHAVFKVLNWLNLLSHLQRKLKAGFALGSNWLLLSNIVLLSSLVFILIVFSFLLTFPLWGSSLKHTSIPSQRSSYSIILECLGKLLCYYMIFCLDIFDYFMRSCVPFLGEVFFKTVINQS